MRAVTITDPGTVELSYMWLPAFIAYNAKMKADIEKRLGPELTGRPLTEETLDYAHDRVLDIIMEYFPIPGLRDYLDAMKFVEEKHG